MSKSLGNSLRVSEVVKKHRPLAVRYYLTAAHYRSTIEFHAGSIEESGTAVERIEGFLRRALPGVATAEPTGEETPPRSSARRWTTTSGCRAPSPWSTRP